jgi:hypothetical protein
MLYTKKIKNLIDNYGINYYINLFIDFESTDEEILNKNQSKYQYSDISIDPYFTLFTDKDNYFGLDVTLKEDCITLKELITSLESDEIKYQIIDSDECLIKGFDKVIEYIKSYKETIQEYD